MSFEEVVRVFNSYIEDKINKLIGDKVSATVHSEVERAFDGGAIAAKVDDHLADTDFSEYVQESVGDVLENSCLDDYFNLSDAVSDILGDMDLAEYVDVDSAVENYIDCNIDFDEKAAEALEELGIDEKIQDAIQDALTNLEVTQCHGTAKLKAVLLKLANEL